MAKRERPEKCAFFYRKKFVGDFCLCDKDDPLKRCEGVCKTTRRLWRRCWQRRKKTRAKEAYRWRM